MEHILEQSKEDYLEAILMIKEEQGYVRSTDIAKKLSVTKPSISYSTKRLKEQGLISMDKNKFWLKNNLFFCIDFSKFINSFLFER